MQNSEKGGGADFEKTKDSVRGIIERIRSVEHPDWGRKEDDLGALKTALARYSSELEHLNFRYDARCAELAMLKGQYSELEKKFLMRPDAMRRAAEIEITELVRQKHEVAGQEAALERARIELQREKEGLEREMKERSAARLAELELEYSGKSEQLRVRSENLALREKETAGTEKHLKERIEAARLAAVEELSLSFSTERQAADGAFRKEKTMLAGEAETWRLRAGESVTQLAEARKLVEELEKALEGERQAAAGAGQGRRLADLEKEALARRLEEWEKKGPELEKIRAELKAREERCRQIEEAARSEARPLQERADALQEALREREHQLEKLTHRLDEALAQQAAARRHGEGLEKAAGDERAAAAEAAQKSRLAEIERAALARRLEEWEKKGPELENFRAELKAREAKCRLIEENSRKVAQPYQERVSALELELRDTKRETDKWRLKLEEAQGQAIEFRKRTQSLEKAVESSRAEASDAEQKTRLAGLEKEGLAKRLAEWEKKAPELEKWRAEASAREHKALAEARALGERLSLLEGKLLQSEQARLRLESEAAASVLKFKEEKEQAAVLRKELDGRSAEAHAREQKTRAEAHALGERLTELEGRLLQSQQVRLRLENEAAASVLKFKEEKEQAAVLRKELDGMSAEAHAREQKTRAEAHALGERITELEGRLLQSEQAAGAARLRCEKDVPAAEEKAREANARVSALEQELSKLKEHFGKSLSELAELNDLLATEKEKSIKAEAQKDAERSRKMEDLMAELGAKESALEAGWTRRHKTLEAEQKSYQEEFERRHSAMLEDLRAGTAAAEKLYSNKEAKLLELNKRFTEEFQDREAKARAVEEELRARAAALEAAAGELARDYEQKTAALEALKRKLLAELAAPGEGEER